jgi:hypothetical protein
VNGLLAMGGTQMLKKCSLNRLIVLFSAFGYLFFMIDAILEHKEAFKESLWCYVPIVYSAIGIFATAIAFVRWNEIWIKVLQIVYLAGFAVAAVGTYLHVEELGELEEAPILAPLAFAGLSVLGFLGTLRKWPAEVKNSNKGAKVGDR